ncbi:hypothetical protein EMMF5_006343 [Cystobasidiomycetes sp. EMM_F5]
MVGPIADDIETRDNVYKTFKFTNKTTRLSVIWGLIVPVTAYYIIASQDQKWDFAGKGRSDSILKRPPPSPTPDAE